MLFQIKSYLHFLWKSTNQHGVHSPFVYNLITKCFYNRKKRASYASIIPIYKKNTPEISLKNAKLLNRLVPYLKYRTILIPENASGFISQVVSINNAVSVSYAIEDQDSFDFIYLDIKKIKNNSDFLDTIFSKVHNDSLLLLNSINKSKESQSFWEQIQNHPKTKVTINTFDFGFVFFRKEQEKEHFIIRV
ncbi:hypothetical protein [uncultured Aquimarina sp.]|uniref:hypothetical protein n=1 Tax=uncultured Aquimarina sp. TaxID=575652 RepID=UPI0026102757|nr:hypothetical protein [uncultured Aquimarina sp.]